MSSIIDNPARIGNFTSSKIAALLTKGKDGKSFGKPALTYINEKNRERKLGRSITTESNARPLSWGKLVERQCFDLLGLEYKLCSKDTITHPKYPYWSGSPDMEKFDDGKTVVDIKCPITLNSFCDFVDAGNITEIRKKHLDGEQYYWQLVSNSILLNASYAELIIYCPYQSELKAIRELAENYDGNQKPFAWVNWAEDIELPYLVDGGHYKNLNVFRFEVPEADKKLLEQAVVAAGAMLIH